MRLTRCHIQAPLVVGNTLTLPETVVTHVVRVLRLGVGDVFALFNGDGHDYIATLTQVEKKSALVEITAMEAVTTESPLSLTLVQGIARGEKMDFILQKATELGVNDIVPVFTERSEVRLDGARADKRQAHWQVVIAAACEQSGRACLPRLHPVQTLSQWLENRPSMPLFYLDPEADARLGELSASPLSQAGFVIGPEGGLGERDLSALRSQGATGLRMGKRILRTETAGLAVLAAMQTLHGDF